MVDKISKTDRSINMGRIKSKDTTIEVLVRHYLFSKGFRYKKNFKPLPGCPDIVLPKYRLIIFVHGCFWHGHNNCHRSNIPKSNTDYWSSKISKNIERDEKIMHDLTTLGWKVIVIWECEIERDYRGIVDSVINQYLV